MFLSVLTKNSSWESLTKNLVTEFYNGGSLKNLIFGGVGVGGART